MNPKRISQRERAVTAYFASQEAKEQFRMMAIEMGISQSKLASLIMQEAMVKGFVMQLKPVRSVKGVKSRASIRKPPPSRKRTRAKTETTRK